MLFILLHFHLKYIHAFQSIVSIQWYLFNSKTINSYSNILCIYFTFYLYFLISFICGILVTFFTYCLLFKKKKHKNKEQNIITTQTK